jgi:hypothetical protein
MTKKSKFEIDQKVWIVYTKTGSESCQRCDGDGRVWHEWTRGYYKCGFCKGGHQENIIGEKIVLPGYIYDVCVSSRGWRKMIF